MVKKAVSGQSITNMVFIGLVMVLLFLFLNNPFSEVKELANYNLLLIGSLGVLIFGTKGQFFKVEGSKDLINDAAVGVIMGIIGIVLISTLLMGAQSVFNLLGTIPSGTVGSFSGSPEQLLFVAVIFPLTETIILVGGGLFLYSVLKNVKQIPFPKVIAGLIIVFMFAAWHFNGIGVQNYEYSPAGFINFIGNTQLSQTGPDGQPLPYCGSNSSGPCVSSAFPQLLMGMFWVGIGFGFRSWPAAAFAHITMNTYSLISNPAIGLDPTLALVGIFLLGIVAIVWQKNRLSELNTFKLKDVFS